MPEIIKMKSFKQFIIESKEPMKFDTNQTMKYLWLKQTEEAMKKFNIHFDLENYDASSKDGDVKTYKTGDKSFKYQKCWAGGDWQQPSILYRCQLVDGYVDGMSQYGQTNGCFVFIPNDKEGNVHLQKTEKGDLVPPDDNDKNPKPDENLCLQSLKKYLDGL